MSKLSRKLVLSVLTLVLSVVALGTTTFAWFSIGSQAEIQAFEVQATAGEGLEISVSKAGVVLDKATAAWYSSIPLNVMIDVMDGFNAKSEGTAVPATARLDAVTSEDGAVFKGFSNGAVTDTAGATGKYLSFNLHFRTRALATSKVKWYKALLTGENKVWTVDVPFGGKEVGNEIDAYLVNALRVSVVGSSKVVYELPAEGDTANRYLGSTAFTAVDGLTANAHSYFAAKKPGVTLVGSTVAPTVDVNTTASLILASLTRTGTEEFAYGSVVVNVWIEGWDLDAYDNIFNLFAKIELGFELA